MNMNKTLTILAIFLGIVFSSSSCDNGESDNQVTIGGTVHFITDAYYIDYELHEGDYYQIGLLLYGMTSTVSSSLVSFQMYSDVAHDIGDGSYTYSKRNKKFSFNSGSWNVNGGTPVVINKGTIDVLHLEKNKYLFTLSCEDENGYPVTGKYEGEMFEQELKSEIEQ